MRPTPVLLLHEDDELSDVAALLRRLGVGFEECGAAGAVQAASRPHDVVVTTARLALSLASAQPATGVRIAISAGDSDGLRAGLRASGVDTWVRRPIHPEALRLLLLRALYRGPERRRSPRVAADGKLRFRAGLRWREGELAELSEGGCVLRVPRALRIGRRVRVALPDPAGAGERLVLRARVARANVQSPSDPAVRLALQFETLLAEERVRLAQLVAAHERASDAAEAETAVEALRERRQGPRLRYAARLVTLGEEAAHVVIARDLSRGGLRIERHGGLECGQRLSLALHGASLPAPLVVRAFVARDDGDAGLLLRFEPLPPGHMECLEKLLADLDGIESLEGAAPEAALVTRLLPDAA